MKRLQILFLLAPVAFFSSCVPPSVSTAPEPQSKITESDMPQEATPITLPSESPSATIIYIAHSEGDASKIAAALENYPALRLTILFPPRYFDQTDHKEALGKFRLFQSSGQIEIGMTLDNEPVLPLLANLKQTANEAQKWDFNFAWPEDVSYAIARGSSQFQKRWGVLPSGFQPPFGALSDQVINSLRRFRLNWTVGVSSPAWGVRYFGGLALLISEPPPAIAQEVGTRAWGEALAKWALRRPYVLIDASQWSQPRAESIFLEELAVQVLDQKNLPLKTAMELVESLGDELALPKAANPFAFDYSPWVSSNLQKRAWQTLSEARMVLDTYQNSGRAQLQRLDAATEEMATAENGPFLLSLGDPTRSESAERNFMATLANIYRLCGTPVPPGLNNLFTQRSFQRATIKPSENDRPFFIEGAQSLTWNDLAGDDVGGGSFLYPVGKYPKGSFDLRELTVSWDESEVFFSISMVSLPPLSKSAVLPMADIYIDINRLSGAGSTTPLRKRTDTFIDKQAAWEYAVAVNPTGATLYQSIPGNNPRILETGKSETATVSFTTAFSRRLLRGDPKNWRLSVSLMGTENGRRAEDPTPVSILTSAGERNFGGAVPGRSVPPYIDLLSPTAEAQKNIISEYESGAKITLPYVEAE